MNNLILFVLLMMIIAVVIGFSLILKRLRPSNDSQDAFKDLEQNLKISQIEKLANLKQELAEKLADHHLQNSQHLNQFKEQLQKSFHEQREQFDGKQMHALQVMQDSLQKGRIEQSEQVRTALTESSKTLSERVEKLTQATEQRLKEISGQVEKRLSEGFEKTTATFTDILKRLALIDEAQKKMTELSNNVVSLQDILNDKRSRGAFGEVQLNTLLRNVLSENQFSLQAVLSNGKRADCLIYLPAPTGNIIIDAKFPLENFQRLMDHSTSDIERKQAEQLFKRDVKQHIDDIASKYIIAHETSDSAIMFIPSESIFAEIYAHHPDLVAQSHKARVWLTSPTTMMAILTTIRSVLKDQATREQVHVIQKHLSALADDFARFQKRMDGLQRHIEQATDDVRDVNISAKKITKRFESIEKVDLSLEKDLATQTPISINEAE